MGVPVSTSKSLAGRGVERLRQNAGLIGEG